MELNSNLKLYDDIIYPSLYKDKLSDSDYIRLKPLFCTQSVEITKIFCSYMRPLCITKDVSKQLELDSQEINEEVKKKLIGTKVGIVRRKQENGIKLENIYIVEEGIIENIEKYSCFQFSSIRINNQDIVPERVFLLD